MSNNVEVQTKHYEEAINLRYKFLYQRNLYYFAFIFVACAAAIFTHSKQDVHSILAQVLATQSGVPVDLIKGALPFRVIYCFISFCVIFALTMLCHRGEITQSMLSYLRRLESDIRKDAGIPDDRAAFSLFHRVDSFYLSMVSWVFAALLLIPVVFLVLGGVYNHLPVDLPLNWSWLGIASWLDRNFEFWVDVFTGTIVVFLLLAYLTRGRRYRVGRA